MKEIRNKSFAFKKSNGGQLIIVGAMTMLSIMFFWVAMVNIGKLAINRTIVTNAADSAAHSASVIKARIMDLTGFVNYVHTQIMRAGSIPGVDFGMTRRDEDDWGIYIPCITSAKGLLGGQWGQALTGPAFYTTYFDDGGKATRDAMNVLLSGTSGMLHAIAFGGLFGGITIRPVIERIARENMADGLWTINELVDLVGGGLENNMYTQQLKRNTGRITVYATSGVSGWIGPFPFLGGFGIPFWIPFPDESRTSQVAGGSEAVRFLHMKDECEEAFSKQTFFAGVKKNQEPAILGSLIGIDNIPETVAIAASRIFNEGGPMFRRAGDVSYEAFGEVIDAYNQADSWKSQMVPVGRYGVGGLSIPLEH